MLVIKLGLKINTGHNKRIYKLRRMHIKTFISIHIVFFIRTKFIRTQAFGHPEIKNMIRTQGFPQQ